MTTEQKSLHYELLKMVAEDVEQVAAIERSCFSNPWPKESFSHGLSNPFAFTLVAREGKTVLGYLVAYLVETELQIANIAVRQECRRKSIGRSLLGRALSQGIENGCRFAILDVRPSNLAAVQLYQSFGFSLLGRRPRYYSAPTEDALIMGKNLS